ncbi:hypothetical protein [Motiliproteus sp. MSK22-1]|uniref:hypothetical protein n=1 Tax=Motiliproteus sp. MSK22-1 TaxID=1897630 RepID=UPI0009785B38|nr:hypothetical protein [Motiliproteus sp. MSK22-1]OMH27150.1 hypothetical protein BGP75_22825 [Motiliproteus sp. MSK22-1]
MDGKKVLNCLILLVVIFGLISCQESETELSDPPAPNSVPSGSVWVGGLDGGVFVFITKPSEYPKHLYEGEIHYVSGDLSYKGKLEIFPKEQPNIDFNVKSSFEGWDGDTLYLINDFYLKIYEP